ncbi:MAG: hypothetical protein HYS12_03440 [Planctomycetes bacterium]|nr:hypothetical protein [Planctomycetota bacterium]
MVTLIRKLEARRKQLLAELRLPSKGLPGSLAQSQRRCGSAGCHCQQGEGHLSWALTYMVDRKKRVDHIPEELVSAVRRRVEEGNAYKSGVVELMAINAQLLILERRARKQQESAAKKRAVR